MREEEEKRKKRRGKGRERTVVGSLDEVNSGESSFGDDPSSSTTFGAPGYFDSLGVADGGASVFA